MIFLVICFIYQHNVSLLLSTCAILLYLSTALNGDNLIYNVKNKSYEASQPELNDYINKLLYGLLTSQYILITAILIPMASGKITFIDIKNIFLSPVGIIALLLSLFTTYLSGLGLQYLTVQGHSDVMPAMILGAVLAAAFLGGVPVGPLMTSGILALGLKIFKKL